MKCKCEKIEELEEILKDKNRKIDELGWCFFIMLIMCLILMCMFILK